ncbi:MAG: YdiU family protein [Flavobacteriaceae bacterium]|nr:YdiU family protein [Flavobacteriaceae bacterium]
MFASKLYSTFTKALKADLSEENRPRQVRGAAYSWVKPVVPSNPKLLHVSNSLLEAFGWTKAQTESETFLELMSGAKVLEHTKPFAMNYGGHQFGQWAGQLGDGRAINLFELTQNGRPWMFQLKGAGPTPYSRRGDGFAVLRSSIREYLCSEAMYHLGVPTTRALSLVTTGDQVLRDMFYNGNAAYETGAVVCRVAPSFVRFGNFELYASQQDVPGLQALADYVICNFYPELKGKENKYLLFFEQVAQRSLEMVLHWQRVGFVHGVMNTDNMSILGLTIDYGPYGWLEPYEGGWTPNTTDAQNKRYRFENQPHIVLWNLLQLANSLYPLMQDAKGLEAALEQYKINYKQRHQAMMLQKLGLEKQKADNSKLISLLEVTLERHPTDMTIFFRLLGHVEKNNSVLEAYNTVQEAFYEHPLEEADRFAWESWLQLYINRLQEEDQTDATRKTTMDAVNPKYVLRNYMAHLAIEAADKGDMSVLEELYALLQKPYEEQPAMQKWFAKRPDWAAEKPGCSMLSCSS